MYYNAVSFKMWIWWSWALGKVKLAWQHSSDSEEVSCGGHRSPSQQCISPLLLTLEWFSQQLVEQQRNRLFLSAVICTPGLLLPASVKSTGLICELVIALDATLIIFTFAVISISFYLFNFFYF